MANKGFFRTVRAFSCGAALLAAALFASVSLFSCSNMGDDYSSASLFSQPLSGGTLVQAKIGKARVCGTIEKDSGVSASVVPTAADVITSAVSYAVYAWGTKADGTEVPQSSPINGTVSSGGAGVTFSIDLDYGTWTVRADALDSSSNAVLSKTTAEPLVLDEDNPLANLSFSLNYLQDPSEPGSLSLTLNYSTTAGIASIRYSLQKKSGGSPLAGTVAAPASGTFTLDSTASSGLGTLVPGDYDLVAEFLSATGATIMRLDQVVQIYSNITTNKIDGSAPYISGGYVNVSDSVITKYQQSVVYVGGTGVNTGTVASDANNGTQFDPVETLGRAFAIADSLISVPTDGVKIYVQDNISLAQDIAIASSKKIRVIGTNQSAPWTISGASSGAATFSITSSGDFSCSYIVFDKINGFEVAGGQTTLNNCKITNGKDPAGKEGGGGLCVDVGGAKAVLSNCQISGCHSARLGGAIHVAADSGSGTAEVELTDCLIGEESASCATNTEFSNHSDQAGGAINVGSGGKLVLTDTKILYNSAPANPGGGIRCMAGTVEISGGQINHNYAGYGGGGIFIMGPASAVTINDCAIGELSSAAAATGLSDCGNYSYDQGGGGIQIESGTLSTTNGFSVIKNYSVKKGGGLNINGAASVTLVSSTISHNASASSGGGVCAAQTTTLFSMTGGAVSDNKAAGNGGGLSLDTTDSASGTFKDVQVKSNEAAGNGGGIQITNGRFLTMTGACDVSGNKADNGGGVYASGTLKMQGGTISGNTATSGGGAYVSGGKLVMSGDAAIPAGTDKKNDVYLTDGTSITIGSTLDAATTPVATITPAAYAPGTTVLSDAGTGASAGALVQSELSKIAVTPQSADDEWTIGYDSSTKKGVLATANIYVSGGSDGNDSTGTGSSAAPYKTVAFALTKVMAPNCSIIIKESTTESEALNVTAAMTGLTIKSADTAPKTITGLVTKKINLGTAATISKIAFDTWGSVDVSNNVVTVELNDVSIKNSYNGVAGGGLRIGSNAKVKASNLELDTCYAGIGGGGIFVSPGSELNADGLTVTGCYAEGTAGIGGGICNGGTLFAKDARISGCSAAGGGAAIYNDNGATLVLDGDCNIDSQIYLFGGSSTLPAKPIYVKAYFGLASGAPKIPVAVEERIDADKQFNEGDAVVQGWDTYDIKEAQVNCFATSGTALSLEYDGAATPPCGKLVDKSIAGGVTVNLGGSILFEIGTPSASGEKARFNVIDNSSGTPTYVTPTSAQIKILQYGTPVYSAAAQEVAATYLSEGQYELYCKAVVGGVTYDTTLPFGAGAKYTPLTLEAAVAGAVVTFDNKASGPVTYRVNGGTEQTIASGEPKAITLNAVGDKVQFFGDNAKYGALLAASSSNISCSAQCYVYGNVMSLVKSSSFASEDRLTEGFAFTRLFKDNVNITNKDGIALLLPATALADACYNYMFQGCTSLKTAPTLPATSLTKSCYNDMFQGCTSLEAAPELPATIMANGCYGSMFSGCTRLKTAPVLPATTLASNCYNYMFMGCTALETAPALPVTTLESSCYNGMFQGCTNLAAAPALPAINLAQSCYSSMFRGCTKIETAPALPATTLADSCYSSMFYDCTGLKTAPTLPATTLANSCYYIMFDGCTSLTTAPALPAINLARSCYSSMFNGCTSLATAPELPATTLKTDCYKNMFNGCTNLNSVTCLATDISATDCTKDWLKDVAATGTFTKAAAMADWTVDSASGIPTGWMVVEAP